MTEGGQLKQRGKGKRVVDVASVDTTETLVIVEAHVGFVNCTNVLSASLQHQTNECCLVPCYVSV